MDKYSSNKIILKDKILLKDKDGDKMFNNSHHRCNREVDGGSSLLKIKDGRKTINQIMLGRTITKALGGDRDRVGELEKCCFILISFSE